MPQGGDATLVIANLPESHFAQILNATELLLQESRLAPLPNHFNVFSDDFQQPNLYAFNSETVRESSTTSLFIIISHYYYN